MNIKTAKIAELPVRPMQRYNGDRPEFYRPAMVMTMNQPAQKSTYSKLGLCLFYAERLLPTGYFWMPSENKVIQTYRALLLLDRCRIAMDDIFCACWYCVGRNTDQGTLERYFISLEESLVKDPQAAREEILDRPINQSEINNIFGPIVAGRLPIDIAEITAEESIGAIEIPKNSNLYYLMQQNNTAWQQAKKRA